MRGKEKVAVRNQNYIPVRSQGGVGLFPVAHAPIQLPHMLPKAPVGVWGVAPREEKGHRQTK
ncbi:hypothetical protein ES705_28914 [subsurface metagenome]